MEALVRDFCVLRAYHRTVQLAIDGEDDDFDFFTTRLSSSLDLFSSPSWSQLHLSKAR
jgi:hypothetical protein